MKCSNCGAELGDGAKFCGECGTKVVKATFCPECGAKCAPGMKFCSECGHKLGGSTSDSRSVGADDNSAGKSIAFKYIDPNCYGTNQWNLCKSITESELNLLKGAAAKGDGDAEYVLGWHCFVRSEDEDEAVKYFERSAEKGSGFAQFAVGRYYQQIKGDSRKSFSLIEKSVPIVGVPALWELAFLILEEDEIEQDPEEALVYLEKMQQLLKQGTWDALFGETAEILIPAVRDLSNGDVEALKTLFDCFTNLYVKACEHDTDCGGAPFVVNSWCYGDAFMKLLRKLEQTIDLDDEERCGEVRNVLLELAEKDDEGEIYAWASTSEDSVFMLAAMGEWHLKNKEGDEIATARKAAEECFEKAAALGDPYSAARLKEEFANSQDEDDDEDEMLDEEDE